jgi:hypothetical protein
MENATKGKFFNKLFLGLTRLFFLGIFLFVFFWFHGEKIIEGKFKQLTQKETVQKTEIKLPALTGSKEVTYTWKYAGKSYTLTETLYESAYAFYTAQPKIYTYVGEQLPENWEEEYFAMFLHHPAEDTTLFDLAQKIKALGEKNKLSEDGIVELTLAFVQALNYDQVKAQKVLNGDKDATPNYPYEVLYTQQGICSDKSLLAYSLIQALDYGAALFVYDKENHMAIGIQCPKNYSNYASGYCYAETTTTGNKIGLVPELDSVNNQATAIKEFSHFSEEESSASAAKTISEVKIMQKKEGKTYTGILQTFKTQQNINALEKTIAQEKISLKKQKKQLTADLETLEDLKKDLDALREKEKFAEYNKLVPKYNDLLTDYQKAVKNYNKQINSYNEQINTYNKLIKSFY